MLAIIGRIGTAGGTGQTLEFRGPAIEALTMEGRMTVCNMAIEGGARAGLIAVDDVTFDYLKGRPFAPKGDALGRGGRLLADAELGSRCCVRPIGHHRRGRAGAAGHLGNVAGTRYRHIGSGAGPEFYAEPARRSRSQRALVYMGLEPGRAFTDIELDRVFIGSCTNARIEDLRAAAAVVRGRKVSSRDPAGDGRSRLRSGEASGRGGRTGAGLPRRRVSSGASPGCSMCLAMNADRLEPGERCAATSNRNFEGRQGHGGRTHLVSPAMAAAAAVAGHFTDVRDLLGATT